MTAFEPVVLERQPDMVVVVGDVNSTIACALVASKLGVRVAHVEAGLRSFDREMPEEINRLLTDQISDLLFVTEQSGVDNLLHEGVASDKIFLVGNVMIDTLIRCLPMADPSQVLRTIQIRPDEPYVLVTLHRPANVDTPETLLRFIAILGELASEVPVIFPMHPRTRARVGRVRQPPGLHLIEPVGYLEFVGLERDARLVITDSGGVQEETTYLGVPCLTVRPNTERPVTITEGTNTLIGADPARLLPSAREQLSAGRRRVKVPQLWDGLAAERIADVLARVMRG
jgi:UDP-N-acetylglucosamine 2-epimerase (non-hydrolysing)